MGVNYNASATTDGLVFYVDAANPKSYLFAGENYCRNSTAIGDVRLGASGAGGYDNGGCLITLNAGIAPDGSNTATLIDQLGNTNNYVFGQSTLALRPTSVYTYSIYFKQDNGTNFVITIDENANGGQRYALTYTYSTQAVVTGPGGGGLSLDGSIIGGTVTSVGNGWFRAALTFKTSSTPTGSYNMLDMIRFASGGPRTYVWGRQLERGATANTFIPTTSSVVAGSSTWIDMINGNNVTLYNNPGFYSKAIQFREASSGSNAHGVAQVDYGIMRQSGARGTWTLETVFTYLTQTSGNGNFGVIENVIFGRAGCHGGIYTWSPNLLYADIKTQDCWTGYSSAPFGSVIPGNTYHCVMTYNNGVTKTYLNGYYVGTGSMNVDIYYPVYGTALYLGGIPSYNPNIDMHVARAYTKELSTSEVLQNYNAFKGRGGM